MKRKTVEMLNRCLDFFQSALFNHKHLFRDIVIISLLVIFSGVFLGLELNGKKNMARIEAATDEKQEEPLTEEKTVLEQTEDIKKVQSHIDTSSWISYQNTWYGFSLKYPDTWADPTIEKAPSGMAWEQKVHFRPKNIDGQDPFEGFDVTVYTTSRVKELSNTDEFPQLKSEEMNNKDECLKIEGHLLETGDYPAEEIYIPIKDECYNATLFFSNTRGEYIYNISPELKDGAGLAGDPEKEIKTHMPEFFSSVSTWNLIDIRRPKPTSSAVKKPALPRVTAPMPYSYDMSGGRRVCAKKNDHPSYSTKHKGKHMDMECCLDPDETPNPNCHYSPEKYGKYL